MSISKNERVLIVINEIASGEFDFLYSSIEGAGRALVQTILGNDYAKIVKLYDANATLAKLIAALKFEGARTSIKRIDLIVMLHGRPGRLIFHEGSKNSSAVKNQIKALNIQSKLRLVYSTACFGDSHSADFIAAGFDAAIGSKKVNANAGMEFGLLLGGWKFNFTLSDCLAPTIPLTPAVDTGATAYGHLVNTTWKNDVDSTKVIRPPGPTAKNLKIST